MATGEGAEYLDPAFNYIDIFESGVTSFGDTRAQDSFEVLKSEDAANKKYRRLNLKENKVAGGLVINGVAQVQEFTLLTKYAFDVSEFKDKLLDPAFSPVDTLRKRQKEAAALGLPVEGKVLQKMRCTRCGYIMIGEIPENCPLCGAPKEEFEPID
jgi:rubrerythrin